MSSTSLITDLPAQSTPHNRSLERGMEVLRAFRPGSALLGNGEIAERTGLAKSTVSRLTHTLVSVGMLQWDAQERAYRLAPAVLSLGHAMRAGSQLLSVAAPMMRELAQREQINVGLAAADRDEMVYLESIRYARRTSLRQVVSGQRVPMVLTSLGRAYLAALEEHQRAALLTLLAAKHPAHWPALSAAIDRARAQVVACGYCAAAWQPEVVALAAPLQFQGQSYALNISLSTTKTVQQVEALYGAILLALRNRLVDAL